MPREKIVAHRDPMSVEYSRERWEILRRLRDEAKEIMHLLPIKSYVHGSVARGDVGLKSDIDIIIPERIPSYLVESYIDYQSRYLIQATPNSAIKAVYEIDARTSLTFPLTPFNNREMQFYDFGGKSDLTTQRRVMGINKKLLFVEPIPKGHIEWSIIGREYEAARKLNIDEDTVRERIRVLTRRDKIGRTGVYLRIPVPPNKSVEEYLRNLADRDPIIRRVVRER